MSIELRRVYDPPGPDDVSGASGGVRILVDRLWPRGLTKEKARIDVWLKAVAPSNDLRRWIHQNMAKWAEFESRYFVELDANPEAVAQLLDYLKRGDAVLLYAAKSTTQNHARVLKAYVEALLAREENNR